MGASFIRLLRNSPAGAWVVLALTVILPLFAFLFLLDLNQDLNQTCTPGLLFRGVIGIPCSILRIASFGVSAAGAFVVIVLLWWLFTELIGLRRIFEAAVVRRRRGCRECRRGRKHRARRPVRCGGLDRARPVRISLHRHVRH